MLKKLYRDNIEEYMPPHLLLKDFEMTYVGGLKYKFY